MITLAELIAQRRAAIAAFDDDLYGPGEHDISTLNEAIERAPIVSKADAIAALDLIVAARELRRVRVERLGLGGDLHERALRIEDVAELVQEQLPRITHTSHADPLLVLPDKSCLPDERWAKRVLAGAGRSEFDSCDWASHPMASVDDGIPMAVSYFPLAALAAQADGLGQAVQLLQPLGAEVVARHVAPVQPAPGAVGVLPYLVYEHHTASHMLSLSAPIWSLIAVSRHACVSPGKACHDPRKVRLWSNRLECEFTRWH